MKTILLLKMDHIGDALWSFPAIRALRAAFPAARIDMLCTPYLAEAFSRLEDLTRTIAYDSAAPLPLRLAVLRKLRAVSYDQALILGPVDKVNHLSFLSGAQERIGYSYSGSLLRLLTRGRFLTRHCPHPADAADRQGLPLPHEVPVLLSLAELCGAAPVEEPVLFFPVTAEESATAGELLQELCPGRTSFAALHLCAKAFRSGWNAPSFARLAAKLSQSLPDTGWIVTAGPAEKPYLETYHAMLSDAGIPIVTGLDLARMAALLSRLRLLVSWDTGVVHLATAVGAPVVDIFPAKDFDYCVQRWGPWGPAVEIVRQETPALDAAACGMIAAAARRISLPKQEVASP